MSEEVVITCPKRSCSAPLRLPISAVGQPLSCPHCRTALRIELDPSGQPIRVDVIGTNWRMPKLLIVPGFALMILGGAGLFANAYVAGRCWNDPGFNAVYARARVDDLRGSENLTGPAGATKKRSSEDASPQEAFAALAGTLAYAAYQEQTDAALAEEWAPYVARLHSIFAGISLVSFIGGACIVWGRFYWLAILGCVAAIVNVNLMCCVPGTVAGLWGILTIVRDEGRKHFGYFPKAP